MEHSVVEISKWKLSILLWQRKQSRENHTQTWNMQTRTNKTDWVYSALHET